jgi:penicillin-binding protein 1C
MTPWARRLRQLPLILGLLFLAVVLGERGLGTLFPFPQELLQRHVPARSVWAADGSLLRVAYNQQGECSLPVDVDRYPRHLIDALLTAEDQHFFSHGGVDYQAVSRAVIKNLQRGRVVSGASTITMQLVRILSPRPRTLAAKVTEAFRARQLERLHSKKEILELYMNLVPIGGVLRGFEAASWRWFGKPAAELRLDEAATLVSMLPAPSHRSPRRRPELLTRRRDTLLESMVHTGKLDGREAVGAMARPLGARWRPWPFRAPHFSDHVLRHDNRPGPSHTELELPLQAELARIAGEQSVADSDGVALVVLDRESTAVQAMVGSPSYSSSQLNAATRRRSAGSTLKPFLYALALELGVVQTDGLVSDVPLRFPGYEPVNFTRDFKGALPMTEALSTSRNLPAVRILLSVSPDRFANLLRDLGLPVDPRGLHLDAALGTMSISPLELGRAYARFCSEPTRLGLSTSTVERILAALSSHPLPGGGATAGRVAWKTGTSSGRRDAWCIGITERHVCVVWLGNLSGRGAPELVGVESAALLMGEVLAAAGG